MKKLLFIALLISHSWGAFSYYKTKTPNASEIPSDQTNFTVMIHDTLTAARVTNASGFDIGFYSDQCTTKLKWEMEYFNSGTGEYIAWVKIPTLAHTSPGAIYVCFDDATISTFQGDSLNAWNSNYKRVFHFGTPSALSLADATNTTNAINHGATATTGKINGGSNYVSASSQYMDLNTTQILRNQSNTTWAGWVYNGTGSSEKTLYGDGNTTSNLWYGISWEGSNNEFRFEIYQGNSSFYFLYSGTLAASTWYHVVITANSSSKQCSMYINGSLNVGNTTWNGTYYAGSPANSQFGDAYGSGGVEYWDGVLDEVQLMNTDVSADWASVLYSNQKPANDFFSSSAETANSSGPTRAQLMRRVW